MRKRALSTILAFMLVLGLFPATAFAAEGHWAQQAVDKLNGIYGDNVFTASDDAMTEGDAYSVLQRMDSASNEVTGSSTTRNLTRGKACTILTEIFHIPIPTDNISAIQYLYNQNIINGTASGLDENGAVTKAQFAVLTYRVLNFVGGGMAESTDVLKPGTEEYFAWMYLAARCCVPFETTALDTQMSSATVKTIVPTTTESGEVWNNNNMVEKTGSELWNAWVARLTYLGVSTNEASYSESDTLIAAAMKLVKATDATEIFTDVQPDDWYYDGVMYLFDERIVEGYGNGFFIENPEGTPKSAQRYELAVLIYAATGEKDEETKLSGTSRIQAAVTYVLDKGYMTGEALETPQLDQSFNLATWLGDWANNASRQEAAYGILKACAEDMNVTLELEKVNTAVLDRFSDATSITAMGSITADEVKQYLAYAVSHGLISGTDAATLSPGGTLNRGHAGVLMYRVLIGLDTTKMQDYQENVGYAKSASASTFSLRAATNNTLVLREDWRLTSELDLSVPKGETLTIEGNGYHIYEMDGTLQNNSLGVVAFSGGTILYPASNDGDAEEVIPNDIWDAEESNKLMLIRQPHAVTIDSNISNGTVAASPETAKKDVPVTLTVSPATGYELDTITVTAIESSETVTVSNNSFAMPASDVTVTATFKQSSTTPITTYAVTFEANGGSGSMSGATVNAGSSYILPANGFTAPANQQFKAWKISNTEYEVGDTYTVNADTNIIAVWEDIPVIPATYTVTVNSSYANSSGAGSYAEGASVTISAGSRSNYSFTGWTASGVTLSSPSSAITTFTMPANAVTVTANWSYNAPSYSDDDDYTPSTPSTESVTVPISGDEETIHVGASVKGDTATIDEVDLSKLETVIGDDVDTGTVTIDFSGLDSSKPITTVEIPSDVVKQIAEAVNNPANDAESLEIILSDGISIEFDAEALGEKAAQADGLDITISIENAKDAKPNQKQEAALKGRPAYDITVTSGGEHISNMGGKITVHAPYELKDGEHPRGIIVWYVDEDGKRERCETSYDPVKKRVNWKTDHLSLYMIDYDESAINPFTDISEDTYYYEAVLWALDNEITSGTSATTFSPDDPCTRAQMATFLWRAAGSPDPVGNSNPFADVSEDTYYAKAVQWAYEQGITGGTSATTFSPDAPCTRGQMVTFLHRVAGTPKPVDSINPFTDVPDAYYTEAVQWAYEQGITAGTSATTFSPDEICARGQMVTFLYRFFVK